MTTIRCSGLHLTALLVVLLAILTPFAAKAQSGPGLAVANPAEQFAIAPGGVDMATGRYVYKEIDVSAGDLALTRTMHTPTYFASPFANFSHEWVIGVSEKRVDLYQSNFNHGSGNDYRITVHIGGVADTFDSPVAGGFTQSSKSGFASLSVAGTRDGPNAVYTYRSTDGTSFEFRALASCGALRCGLVSKAVKPDGTTLSFNYSGTQLTSVVSSRGYAVLMEYGGGTYVNKSCVLNLSVIAKPQNDTCPSGAQATATYSYIEHSGTRLSSVTGSDGQTSGFTYGTSNGAITMGFVKPGAQAPWLTNSLSTAYDVDENPYEKTDAQAFADGQNPNGQSYSYAFIFMTANDGEGPAMWSGTATDALGGQIKVKYAFPIVPNTAPAPETCAPPPCTGPIRPDGTRAFGVRQHTPGPISVTDQINRVITSEYCSVYTAPNTCVVRPLVSSTEPGGNKTLLTYGLYDNVTEVRRKPKPGVSPVPPDIVTSATYLCINHKSCAKPNTVTDANGNVTTYTYSADHGGLLTETGPAVRTRQANGTFAEVQSQKRYTYQQRYARISDGSGGYVQVQDPSWLLVQESYCRKSAAHSSGTGCSAANDEVVIAYDYGPDSGPNTLLLRGQSVTAEGETLRTCFTYDERGNKLSETLPEGTSGSCPGTPPIEDAPHMTAYRYDAANRLTGTILPDPDGTGTLKFPVVRNTYDAAGRLTKVEQGEIATWQSQNVAPVNWTGITIVKTVDTVYDQLDRKVKETVSGGTATPTVTQYSYDAGGRLKCVAMRMDPADYAALPPSACDHSAAPVGQFGPDRITRNEYDAAGQLRQARTGVGTPAESANTFTYTPNAKRAFVIDGRGNKAELRYDGQDRLERWVLPSTTGPTAFNDSSADTAVNTAGALNEADYESYEYDAAGNREKFRKRDGSELTYNYDALNRMREKVVPERPAPHPFPLSAGQTRDVYYAYDLRGLQTDARFDGENGEGLATAYDGFGRLTRNTSTMGGSTRILNYDHDKNGNRTELTYPDGAIVSFEYDGLNRMERVWEGALGSTTSLGYMVYNNRGLRQSMQYQTDSTTYDYDGVGRLAAFTDTYVGTSGNTASTFSYNPASQITAITRTNDLYAWNGHYNVNRDYSTNGLNQYTQAGTANLSYDANGNLVQSPAPVGVNTYLYDVENRLVQAGGGASITLVYDPLGRLFQTSGGSGGTVQYVYDGDELAAEYDGSGNILRRYVHGAGVDDPIVWYEKVSGVMERRSLHPDRQGSIVAITQGTGALLTVNRYDEYGIPSATNLGRFQYTGQAWIHGLDMYYYKARIYSPTLGRFMQTDPIGYEDQINLYAYVGNDPLNINDPTGRCKSIPDPDQKADCQEKRQQAIQNAREYLDERSSSNSIESAYIETYDAKTGDVTVRMGNEAAVRTTEDVLFLDEDGNPLQAQQDGRITQGEGKDRVITDDIVLVTGHDHPRDVNGGRWSSVDRANENPMRSEKDPALSTIAPAVIKTPSGKVKLFINKREVRKRK